MNEIRDSLELVEVRLNEIQSSIYLKYISDRIITLMLATFLLIFTIRFIRSKNKNWVIINMIQSLVFLGFSLYLIIDPKLPFPDSTATAWGIVILNMLVLLMYFVVFAIAFEFLTEKE